MKSPSSDLPAGEVTPGHSMDLALARRAAAGVPSAWMDLIQRHQRLVHGLLIRHVRPQEREDLFQEIFLRVHRGLPRYEGHAALSTWIFQIGINAIRSHWEVRARLQQREVLATDHLTPREEGAEERSWDIPVLPTQDEALEARMTEDRLALMKAEIRAMKPLDRQVLLLRELEGCSYEEIATRLGLALGTVKSRLARARGHLAARLKGGRP